MDGNGTVVLPTYNRYAIDEEQREGKGKEEKDMCTWVEEVERTRYHMQRMSSAKLRRT